MPAGLCVSGPALASRANHREQRAREGFASPSGTTAPVREGQVSSGPGLWPSERERDWGLGEQRQGMKSKEISALLSLLPLSSLEILPPSLFLFRASGLCINC